MYVQEVQYVQRPIPRHFIGNMGEPGGKHTLGQQDWPATATGTCENDGYRHLRGIAGASGLLD